MDQEFQIHEAKRLRDAREAEFLIIENEESQAVPHSTPVAVIVLGMHRSGTSALTGVLAALGLDAGSNLQNGNEFNPRGYWEHREVVRIHDELLVRLGSSWHDTKPLPDGWRHGSAAAAAREALLEVLRRDFGACRLWVVKDPRVCRLLPLWLDILDELGAKPRFVIAARHPAEVAASLAARDGMALSQALLLYLAHMVDAERLTRGYRRVAMPYEELLGDWRTAVTRIDQVLDLSLGSIDAASSQRVEAFLTPDLRHHHGRSDPAGTPRSPLLDLAITVFEGLSRAGTSEEIAIALETPGQLVKLVMDLGQDLAQAPRGLMPYDLATQIEAIRTELESIAIDDVGGDRGSVIGQASALPLPSLSLDEEEREYRRAEQFLAEDRKAEAMAILQSLAQRQAICWEIYNDLGTLLFEAGNIDEAVAALHVASNLELSSSVSLRNLAAVYVAAENMGHLLVVCQRLLQREPDNQDVILFLRDVVLSANMRFDDYGWLSPEVAGIVQERHRLAEKAEKLAQENARLAIKAKLYDRVASLAVPLSPAAAPVSTKHRASPGESCQDALFCALNQLDEPAWLQALLDSTDGKPFNGISLPGFPAEDLQRRVVGTAGKQAVQFAFRFYQLVKSYAQSRHPLDADAVVLDYGCGWGRMLRCYLHDTPASNLLGLDVDPAFLEICRKTYGGYGRFLTATPDGEAEVATGSVDLIYSHSVFFHLAEETANRVIGHLHGYLKPGGILVLTTQGLSFLDFCESFRDGRQEANHAWHDNLKECFRDQEQAYRQYEKGEYLYAGEAVHNSTVRPRSFYGQAIISRRYVETHWTDRFDGNPPGNRGDQK